MTKNIEVEVRGLITKDQFDSLCQLFAKEGKFVDDKDRIVVCYPDPETGSLVENMKTDIRIRSTNGIPEVMIKLGEWGGEESRRELSLPGKKGEFDKMIVMLAALGHTQGIIAVRQGKVYEYKDIEFSLVEVPGHSYYFEAEVMTADESEKQEALRRINKVCKELSLELLSQEEFYSYINKLNEESNEPFDFAHYEEGYFNKRFGI